MKRTVLTAGIVVALGLGATACGGEEPETPPTSPAATSPAMPPATSPAPQTQEAGGAPFGPGCSALPTQGPGSPESVASKPVATAVSESPDLSTLATAVKEAGLVETLNSAQDITVFAPTNDAFAKIPEADLNKVLADKKQLTALLQYHVVEGRKTPADLGSGSFKTLQGGTVTTKGSGTEYTVNDAKVVCGNVPTSNATVYIIDTVLMPPQ
ncbi:fasciclin domain-containing protein [Actinocorallia sp. B10E7]|uniref:fasciclin domain-containing protein n=1 Tax=Actinocorallia sp. B10E7 TaxID=3153558 RepID=UPI00325E8E89